MEAIILPLLTEPLLTPTSIIWLELFLRIVNKRNERDRGSVSCMLLIHANKQHLKLSSSPVDWLSYWSIWKAGWSAVPLNVRDTLRTTMRTLSARQKEVYAPEASWVSFDVWHSISRYILDKCNMFHIPHWIISKKEVMLPPVYFSQISNPEDLVL